MDRRSFIGGWAIAASATGGMLRRRRDTSTIDVVLRGATVYDGS